MYGNSYKRYLIALVVPDPDVIIPWAKQNGIEVYCNTTTINKLQGDMKSIVANPKAEQAVLEDMNQVATQAKVCFLFLIGYSFALVARIRVRESHSLNFGAFQR